jgi:hypothetical protein
MREETKDAEAEVWMQKIQTELVQIGDRLRDVELELTRPISDGRDSAFEQFVKAGGAAYGVARTAELQEEYQHLQQREHFLKEALEEGRRKLDALHGQSSLRKCEEQFLPRQLKRIERRLSAIKEICDTNTEELKDRAEEERNGTATGSVPSSIFDIGLWDDSFGGMVVAYRRYIEQSFPQLSSFFKGLRK